ncbi:MAG TPA: serine hydrolase [Chitinophagaceae bacterium]|nr:serine hydrolase [Chitinophagaceae bacterium]
MLRLTARRLALPLFTVILLLSAGIAYAQYDSLPGPAVSFLRDSLDSYVRRALADWRIPGAAVCVVKDGRILVLKGYGVTDLDHPDPVDENTLFMIGSNTKAFTATALCLLESEKKLSLDDPVTRWLPQFRLDNRLAGQQAILRDLLCHRIGFRTFQGDFTYWTSNLTRDQVIEKMAHIKAVYPFRTTWGYTNAAFLTAGQVIPRVTGLSWEAFVRQRFFQPLDMTRTLALSEELPVATNKCSPYTISGGKLIRIPFPRIDNLAPAGSISSSVHDMSHWLLMQLNHGTYRGKPVIPASVIEETRTPASIIGNGGSLFNSGHFALYGLGWFLEEYGGRKIVSHTGGVNGFVTSVTLVPEERLGILVFTNNDQNGFYEALKWEILDAFLDKPYRNYSQVYLGFFNQQMRQEEARDQRLRDTVAMHLPTGLSLAAYTGTYSNPVYGTMRVGLESHSLVMRFSHHPDVRASLSPLGGDRFYVVFSDPELGKAVFPFHVEGGRVRSVTVKVADFVEYTPYEFTRLGAGK